MAKSGKIGDAEMLAANRWCQDYAMGVHGVFDADQGGRSSGTRLFAQERQLAAATNYRQAAEALGSAGTTRMVAVLAEGNSLTALGVCCGAHTSVISRIFAADLARLAEHYTRRR